MASKRDTSESVLIQARDTGEESLIHPLIEENVVKGSDARLASGGFLEDNDPDHTKQQQNTGQIQDAEGTNNILVTEETTVSDKPFKEKVDNEKEAKMLSQEGVDTEHEDQSASSSVVKKETSGDREYFGLSRVEDEATNSGDNENTAAEPPRIMEKATTMTAKMISAGEENITQFKDTTEEEFTEDAQVKRVSPDSHQGNMTEGNTDNRKEAYKLPEKNLENLFALSKQVETQHEDLSNISSIVTDDTSTDIENEHLSRLEAEIRENGDKKSLIAIEEVNTLPEYITSQDEKREEQKIQTEDAPRESMAENIIFQSKSTARKGMQTKHIIHAFTEESGTSPASPEKEIAKGYSDDREAKQLPEEIAEDLSIVSKEVEPQHSLSGLSIDPSIDKNETIAERENDKLAVEEHPAEDTVRETSFEAESTTIYDDNTELKISQMVNISPEPMEESILSHNDTEENMVQAEGTSRQSTEEENFTTTSPELPVAEGHIKDGEETKEFHVEKYENLCIGNNEEEEEHKDLIHDSSTCETGPWEEVENLKVQGHPKDENPIEALSMEGNIASQGEKADEEKVKSEDNSKKFTENDHVIETSIENPVDVKVREEFHEEMIVNGDNENLTTEASPNSAKIIEEASPVAENIILEDGETEEKEMQMEGTLLDTPPESLAKEKADSLANEEAETCTDEIMTSVSESFSLEHAEVERKPKDLGHDSPVSDNAVLTIEEGEELIVEPNEQVTGEASLLEGNTIHQDDVLKMQKEDAPEKSMKEQNARTEDNNEVLTNDEHATSISPGDPIQDVLQTTTNDGKEEKYSEQKCENLLMESTEIEKDHEDAALDSSISKDETAKENVNKLTADENVKDEIMNDGASSAITAEVIHAHIAISNIEELLSPDDEVTDHKALPEDEAEQTTDTGKGMNELPDLDKSEKHNDQMHKKVAQEQSEEFNEEYMMEVTHEELTNEYHTSTSIESPEKKIVNISAENGKKENELNEENADNHSVEHNSIGADHEELCLQTSNPDNVICTMGENKEHEEDEKLGKKKIIEDKSTSAGNSIIQDNYIEEEKVEKEYVTHESVEGSTVYHDDDPEEKYMQKDHISQKLQGNSATVSSAEASIEISNETSTIDGNKAKESITEECENLTVKSTQENNEMLIEQKDAKEDIIQVSSATIAENISDHTSMNSIEQNLSINSSKKGEGIEQTSEKDMAEDWLEQSVDVMSNMGQEDMKNQIEEDNDHIQKEEIKEQPEEILEKDKIDKQTFINDHKVTKGVGKKGLKPPEEEYEESASRENAQGMLIGTSNKLKEPTISLQSEENSIHLEEKICEVTKEEESDADLPHDKVKYNDANRCMPTDEAFVRSRSVHDGKDAFFLSCQEECTEKQKTEKATREQSQSINEEVHQDLQTDEDKGTPDSSNKEASLLSEQVVDEVNKNQQEHEVKKQDTKSTEETEVVMISDESRESAKNEVAQKNFGKANANRCFPEQNKELAFIHIVEASDKEILLEKTPVHVEASSSATTATAAANVDCIPGDHEESFSLAKNVDTGIQISGKYTTEQVAYEEGYDMPDEDPDAQEKNYDDDEEAASSTAQMRQILELGKKATIEPIEKVDNVTTEVIETVDEAPVTRNKEDRGSQEEDESKQTDTEMQMTWEGHGDPYTIEKLHEKNYQVNIPSHVTTDSNFSESEEVKTTEDGKLPGKSKTLNGSNTLEDDIVNHESYKDSLENQEDYARVEESALETGTLMVISEKDASATIFSRSIQEVEKSASAEMEEPSQQYEAYISKNGSLAAYKTLNSNILVEKDEHETAIGTEEANDKLSNHPSDSTKEDIPEKISRNDEVTSKEETENGLELKCTLNKEDNENKVAVGSALTDQVPLEPEGNHKVKSIIETAENQSDANYLQHDQTKTVINPESAQNEEQKMIDLNSMAEIERSNVMDTPYNQTETSIMAEAVDECHLPEEKSQTSDNPTKRDKELPEERTTEQNLESDSLVEKHDNERAASDTNEKSNRHPADSTNEDIIEETRNLLITDQIPMEPTNVDDMKSTQETAENQIDDNQLQHDEVKTATSYESTQSEFKRAIDSVNITKTDISDRMETPHNQSDASSTVAETIDDCGLEEGQTSQNTTGTNNEPSEKRIKENLESATLIEKDETTTTSSQYSHPADSTKEDVIEEKLRCEVTPTEETETNMGVQCCINREINENQMGGDLIMTNHVPMEPVNEDKVPSVQEAAESQSDANEQLHNEIKTMISSESIWSENKQTTDSNNIQKIESSDKMETPYNNSKVSTVAEKVEERSFPEETGQSSENNSTRELLLPQNNKEENLEPANVVVNLEHETTILNQETNEKLAKHPDSTTEEDMTTERPRNEITQTDVTEMKSKMAMEPENEDKVKSIEVLPEKQNVITDLEHDKVKIEPENEDSIQELPEKQNDITSLQYDEMKTVPCSKSVQDENENAKNFARTTEIEKLDKMKTACKVSKASSVASTLEECGLSEGRGKCTTSGEYELLVRIQGEHVEAETTEGKSLKQTQWEEEIKCIETNSNQRTKQKEDSFKIIEKEEGDRTDIKYIETIVFHLLITCKNEESDGVLVEIPAEDAAKQMKMIRTGAQGHVAEVLIQINENPTIEKTVSDVVEEEATLESVSQANFQDAEEIRKNEMEAKETARPSEAEEQLQQLVPVEEKRKRTIQVTGETAAELKPLPNETEKQLQQQFSELVMHEQKHKGSPLTEDIAEESVESVQSLEEQSTNYSILEQNKDEKCLQEKVDFETSKSLHPKEAIMQEASRTDPEIRMQPRDFSSENQWAVFSPESEEITAADTSVHTSLEESKDAEKPPTAYNKENRDTGFPVQINIAPSDTADGMPKKVCEEIADELNKSEETTNKHEKHMPENSDITSEELGGTKEGFKQCKLIVNEARCDQKSIATVERDSYRKHKDVSASQSSANERIQIPGEECAIQEKQVRTSEMSEMEEYSVKEEGVDAEDPGSIAPTITNAAKATPKKSHNLLSGVGSKVKHSISKVKKAITGKPKNTSPKKSGE